MLTSPSALSSSSSSSSSLPPRRSSRRLLWPALLGAAALGLVAAAPAVAAPPPMTLYVSVHGTASGPGTVRAPYQTIAEAVAAAPPGATIRIMQGTYDVTVPIVLTEAVTITAARGAGHSVITGSAPIFVLGNSSAGVTHVTIRGLAFDNISNAYANGVITAGGYGAGEVAILGNTFRDTAGQAIGYHGNPGLAAPLGTQWRIANNRIMNVTTNGQSGMFLGNLQDSQIVGNTIENTGWAGMLVTGTSQGDVAHDLIAGNRVSQVPHEGIQVAYGHDVQVEYNWVTQAGLAGYTTPGLSMDAAISLYNTSQTNVWVAHNTLYRNYQGVELGQPSAQSTLGAVGTGIRVVDNNLVDNPGGDAVNNATSGTLNATQNWWGSHHGPTASDVVGAVNATPYLNHPVGIGQAGFGHR
ncbi:MAG: right-handed parallel beta-helix repeat-containing protein [Thermaerobacter sp.]|nr:right-handed parallel beta-helix repeat-containing protein [Thermaerobacter sp.]